MDNRYFQKQRAVFECRNCGRRTRDTNGSNGSVRLCEDCDEGSQWENGAMDTSDEAVRAECLAKSDEAFRRAVSKGGVISGYEPT